MVLLQQSHREVVSAECRTAGSAASPSIANTATRIAIDGVVVDILGPRCVLCLVLPGRHDCARPLGACCAGTYYLTATIGAQRSVRRMAGTEYAHACSG